MKNITQEFLEDIKFRYLYMCNTRKTKSQKAKFLQIFEKEMNHLGIQNDAMKIVNDGRATNLVVEDPQTSDIVLIVPYDTPSKSFFTKQEYPLNWNKQQGASIKSVIMSMSVVALLMIVVFVLFRFMGWFDTVSGISYVYAGFTVISVLAMLAVVFGIPETDTLKFTSPSILTAIILFKLLKEDDKNVSIILTDMSYQRHVGDANLNKLVNETSKKVYYLANLGNRDLQFIHKDDGTVATLHDVLPQVTIIASGDKVEGELVIDLKKDASIDYEKLVSNAEMIYNTIKS